MILASSLSLVWLGHAIFSNVIVASLLAIVAALVGWRLHRPAMAHGLWVLVLIKLVTPPIVYVTIPIPGPISAWMGLSGASGFAHPPATAIEATTVLRQHVADATSIRNPHLPQMPSFAEQVSMADVISFVVPFSMASLLFVAGILMTRSLLRSLRFARVLEAEGQERVEATQLGLQMAQASGIGRCPRIRLVSASLSPMLFGFSKWATIVIPSGLWDELDLAQRRAMLAHELSHYKRCDHWVRGLELLVGGLYFWFPLVRVARSQIERMEETCCDLNAVDALGKNRRLYAESLLQVVDYISQRGGRMPGLASGMRPTITLEERLRSIMNAHASGRMSQRHQSILFAIGLTVVLIHPLASASSSPSIVLDASIDAIPLRAEAVFEMEIRSKAELRNVGELPEVPRGWWNAEQQPIASRDMSFVPGKKVRLRFNPGVSIDVILSDETTHRLAESEPTAMVMLPHAARLIVGNGKGDIRIWDLESRQSVSWIGHHQSRITTLCFHPEFGLLSGDANGVVLQWEIQSGALQNSWSTQRGPIQSIRCAADGGQVAIVFGEWKNRIESSSLAYLDPKQWMVTGVSDVPVALASVFDRTGIWHALDWAGCVYQLPFQQKTGLISKADVSSIAFSQDAEIPAWQNISEESLPISSNQVPLEQ